MPGSVQQRAYALWQKEGSPPGRDVEFWLRAEAMLAEEGRPAFVTPVEIQSAADARLDEAMAETFPASDPPASSDAGQIGSRRS